MIFVITSLSGLYLSMIVLAHSDEGQHSKKYSENNFNQFQTFISVFDNNLRSQTRSRSISVNQSELHLKSALFIPKFTEKHLQKGYYIYFGTVFSHFDQPIKYQILSLKGDVTITLVRFFVLPLTP